MIRGTTAQWKFVFPYTKDTIQDVMIMFWQSNNPDKSLPIIKRKQDCQWSEKDTNECYVSLRPSETALFSDKYKAKMQLTVIPNVELGTPFGNKETLFTVYPMPNNLIPDGPEFDHAIQTVDGWSYLDGGTILDN